MRRPGPLPPSPSPAAGPEESADAAPEAHWDASPDPQDAATQHPEAMDAAEPADLADPADYADRAEQDTAPVIPLAAPVRRSDAANTAVDDAERIGVSWTDADRGGADAASDSLDQPVRMRDVWRASRARRKALRAEVRRFTGRQRRRRAIWIGVGVSLAVLVLATLGAAYSPLLALQQITVVGAERVAADDIEDALSGQMGTPLPLVDESAIKAALVRFPLIESYTLEARPPHELVVQLVERTPVGVIESAAGYTLVDAAGVALATTEEREGDAPLIAVSGGVDSDAFEAIGVVMRSLPESILSRVTEVSATTANDVTLRFGDTNTDVVWGSGEDSAMKAVALQKIMATRTPEDVLVYDVSSPAVVVVR